MLAPRKTLWSTPTAAIDEAISLAKVSHESCRSARFTKHVAPPRNDKLTYTSNMVTHRSARVMYAMTSGAETGTSW